MTTMNLKNLKAEAKRLRTALTDAGFPSLSHGQVLDLLAKNKGHADWNTLVAVLERKYFYQMHEPYLPNTAEGARDLANRKANMRDLADLEIRHTGSEPAWSHVMARAAKQVRQAKSGQLKVAPILLEALTAPADSVKFSLSHTAAEMDKVIDQLRLPRYADLVTPADSLQYAYHNAYLHWRLASLVDALRRLDNSTLPLLGELKAQGENLFTYVGRLLATKPAANEEELKKDRYIAKAMLMAYIACNQADYVERSFGLRIEPAEWTRMTNKLNECFPEIALWHAWSELKPLLAADADDLVS